MHTDRACTAPGYVMASPDDGVTLTNADGNTLTVTATGGDRIDVRAPRTLRLEPGTVRPFATAMLGSADYTENRPSPPQFHGPEDSTADDDVCCVKDCDEHLADANWYRGHCGHHADLIESHREGNHRIARRGPSPDCPICSPGGSR